MTCEDLELSLLEQPSALSEEARAHLEGCAACRAFQADAGLLLQAARLPEPSSVERARLERLPLTTKQAWRREQGLRLGQAPRGSWVQRLAGLAVAAGLGAAVASGVLLRQGPTTVHPVTASVQADSFDDELAADDSLFSLANVSDDEGFSEVSWPTTEGDMP
jgi:predicted anti-sigma-YlaC factor YlaD